MTNEETRVTAIGSDGGRGDKGEGGAAFRQAAGAAGANMTRVVVNGRLCVIAGTSVTYDAIVQAAFGRSGGNCSVAFRHGPPMMREGLLLPDQSVEVIDDEVFNVALAVRS